MVAFLSGAVLTAANLNSAFNALTFRAVTGTSDTFVLADNGGAVSYSNASPITATVPPFSSVAYANGTVIQLLNLGAGVVTVTAGAGVTVNGANLTLAQNIGGTLIKTATNTWYFLKSAPNGSGMDLITPTSVAGSGVTLSGGEITLTAATGVNVNGCFSSAYDNYRIVATRLVGSTDLSANLRLRASATDASGANYNSCYVIGGPATASSTRFTGETTARFAIDMNTTTSEVVCDIASPFLALPTGFAYNINRAQGGSIYCMSSGHTLSTSYDGFSLVLTTGNLTGKIRIYGLRNS